MNKIVSILFLVCVLTYFSHALFPIQNTTKLIKLSVEGNDLLFLTY